MEFVLTDEQAATVAHWTKNTAVAVVIGSIHPGCFDGPAAGKTVARVGVIPRERMDAVRAAALEVKPSQKRRSRAGDSSPTPATTNASKL